MEAAVNYLAVFLAGASSMVVGSIWYAKGTFERAGRSSRMSISIEDVWQ